ncbi:MULTISPECIES: glucose 1-dehydrogenase [Cryobacterium]|uniref:3alpha(Or 20beta)-hydroxysteroid dehydrogenase n=1 Tax=Cryobacterium levicorallinum TaxID=995038 RepID=A0A1I2Y2R6_9MICO|nr:MULTISPECIES: glucose 1-dehydrogenase [Cryobacterium]TFB85073.1 SDR family oxidoreductase [Cryobacterium levicorallinum]TFD62442.1 SDR family oxidoreductase [Cryobacterium sp. Hh38]GEP26283.1 3-alpha-(or 20-beta)-hydroxysteroid dehydrogenase [Cryobacterium levicorallinum]SFH18621.1 3alpha(or 20beta)-hydroxysteroid dehydrogenase [Cryobacterium levicorallinum]
MARLAGKVALISGAAQGMGAAHARTMIREGARVVLGDIGDAQGEALADELGVNARYVHLDVTDSEDWDRAVAVAVESFGGLDILVNNAGIAEFVSLEDTTMELWDRTIAINLTGAFRGIQAALPALKQSEHASIINISSIAGFVGFEGLGVYNASKFALRGLTKSVALDLAADGIRVNSVHPGAVRTPMTVGLSPNPSNTAMHRLGEPEEVSNLVLFLASDESSFCTGAEYLADGGEAAGLSNLIPLSRVVV